MGHYDYPKFEDGTLVKFHLGGEKLKGIVMRSIYDVINCCFLYSVNVKDEEDPTFGHEYVVHEYDLMEDE